MVVAERTDSGRQQKRQRRRRSVQGGRANRFRVPLLLASLLCLSGCAGGGEGFWPSTSPPPRGAAVASPPRPFLSLLPENLWELLGGLGLLATGGGVALFLWKFPDLLEEFTNLQEMADRLHERRDRSTADLAQLSRRLTALEKQLIQIRRSSMSTMIRPQTRASGDPLNAALTAPVSRPSAPSAIVDLASDDLIATGSAALALQPPPGADVVPTLETLIAAMNGEGDGPIEGVTCLELDIIPPTEAGESGTGSATRLRLVAAGGRFLLVLLEGNPWLFPSLETLANFRTDQPDEGLFHYLPDSSASPRLVRPALLTDIGGQWEVIELGQILVPTA